MAPKYNDEDHCDARPVVEGGYVPHAPRSLQDGVGARHERVDLRSHDRLPVCCGHLIDKCGLKKVLLIADLASGTATGIIGADVNELSPPHMRNTLGLGLRPSASCCRPSPFYELQVALLGRKSGVAADQGPYGGGQAGHRSAVRRGARHHGLVVNNGPDVVGERSDAQTNESMFTPRYRMQMAYVILPSCTQQLSDINGVFYYSDSSSSSP
ncbi:hypothetical protein PR001_g26430 [Phytophthora rubi]|uniref:Uncharacterized protein n=1 Tax=Phytophthora rubi TaxID=129364 RepID=A0A6A3HX63_9STRA|nr:hypothetical protein PR001_g26430 [Phytophthora rubi]KAE8973632.1 hypothetical protein PR002_g26144 [Phytophthora rubi]